MPIRELLSALEGSASAERQELLERARATADQILAAAERDRTAQLEAALDEHRARRQAVADARFAEAEREQRRLLLVAKERLLARLRERLVRVLPELARDADDRAIEQLVRAAIDCAGTGDLRLRCAPSLVERARRAAAAVPIQPDATVATGVRLSVDDGRLTIDSSLAALLERWWPRLRIAALSIADELGQTKQGGT